MADGPRDARRTPTQARPCRFGKASAVCCLNAGPVALPKRFATLLVLK